MTFVCSFNGIMILISIISIVMITKEIVLNVMSGKRCEGR